jgi:phenylpropionate dioxygenase-like ring-hydroxylating dioxygenase large terminal subunit
MYVSEMTFLRRYWHPVALAAEVKDDPIAVRLLGEDYVVWRGENGVTAAAERFCVHRGGNLADGWVSGDCLVCPYHGWQYDATGRCVHIPHLDADVPIPSRARVMAAHTTDAYGLIWMCPGEPVGPLPRWPEGEDPSFETVVEFFEERNTSAPRVVDNALDSSHVTFVHRGTFASPDSPTMPPVPEVTSTASGGVVGRFVYDMPGIAQQVGANAEPGQRFERTTEIEVLAPLMVRTRFYIGAYPDGSHDYCFLGAASPVDDTRAMYVRVTALDRRDEERTFDSFHEFSMRVQAEDRRILDGTSPRFPLDMTSEVHLRADRLTIEYRRYLARLAASER